MTPSPDLSDLYIELAPVVLPAFAEKTSYWLDYTAIAAAGIRSLRTAPVIWATHMSGINLIWIDCHIVDPVFSGKTHGLPYGDAQFKQEMNSHLRQALRLPGIEPIDYTEQGRQNHDRVSMEAHYEWTAHLERLSHHQILEMTTLPELKALHVAPLRWGTASYSTDY